MSLKGVILCFTFKKMIYFQLLIKELEINYDRFYVIELSFYYYFLSICMTNPRYLADNRNFY
jgi:hypothetical protein